MGSSLSKPEKAQRHNRTIGSTRCQGQEKPTTIRVGLKLAYGKFFKFMFSPESTKKKKKYIKKNGFLIFDSTIIFKKLNIIKIS